MSQMLIKILGTTYSFIALPALAIIAVIYLSKYKTKGSIFFSVGAIMTAIGSMFNQLFPSKIFIDQSTALISSMGEAFISTALIVHLVGFFIMVVGLGMITFAKKVV